MTVNFAAVDNYKTQGALRRMGREDETAFLEAGTRKPIKTFKFDPTKVNNRVIKKQ